MDSQQFLDWLTNKLNEYGVTKIIPDDANLNRAYLRAVQGQKLQRLIDEMMEEVQDQNGIHMPEHFREQLEEHLDGSALPWDIALWSLVRNTTLSPNGESDQ